MGKVSGLVPMAPISGAHLTHNKVGLQDVLELLSSDTTVGSSLGAMLERARDGTSGSIDYIRARGIAEERLLARAPIIRCIDALVRTPNIWGKGEACCSVRKFAVRSKMLEGAAVVGVLRAYLPWQSRRGEKGLAYVYAWMLERQPSLGELDLGKEESAEMAFRVGRCRRQRTQAAEMLADAEVALHGWVSVWNTPRGGGARYAS